MRSSDPRTKYGVNPPPTPTTLKRDRIVHEVTHVGPGQPTIHDYKYKFSFRTSCGKYGSVDDDRAFVKDRSVDCLDCIAGEAEWKMEPGILRGKSADMVYYDEVQDFSTNPCAEVPLNTP